MRHLYHSNYFNIHTIIHAWPLNRCVDGAFNTQQQVSISISTLWGEIFAQNYGNDDFYIGKMKLYEDSGHHLY